MFVQLFAHQSKISWTLSIDEFQALTVEPLEKRFSSAGGNCELREPAFSPGRIRHFLSANESEKNLTQENLLKTQVQFCRRDYQFLGDFQTMKENPVNRVRFEKITAHFPFYKCHIGIWKKKKKI